jgi:molybdate transport system ATP-binding protein
LTAAGDPDTVACLDVDVVVSSGEFRLVAALAAAPDEVVAVIGPNGAGKSTLLRTIAGLKIPTEGRIVLDGRVLDLVDGTRASTHVPPYERRIGFVFQDYRLFPHLSATQNVAFGLQASSRSENAERLAGTWLERVGLAHRASARPEALSGGETARVALARALATEPSLLLLDEPLGAIDVEARQEIRECLREQLASLACPCLLVTHDPVEAALFASRAVVLEAGRVTQTDSLVELARRPRSEWVARMAGVNLWRGSAAGSSISIGAGGDTVAMLTVAGDARGEVFAMIRPRAITLHRTRPEGSARNVFALTVAGLHTVEGRVRVELRGDLPMVAEVTPAAAAELELARGGDVWATAKASEIEVYPA